MGMEDATKKRQVQKFFEKRLQRRPGQPMAKWVNVFEKAVLDMKAEGAESRAQERGLALFEQSSVTWSDKNVCSGQLKANTSSLPFEGR